MAPMLMKTETRVNRIEGAMLLACFVAYTLFLLLGV